MTARLTAQALRGSLAGAAGAALTTGVAALLEARWVSGTQEAAWGALLVACIGLLAPLSLCLGVTLGAALSLLLSRADWRRLGSWFGAQASQEPRVALLLAPLAFTLWLVVCANWSLAALLRESPPVRAGAVSGLASSLLGACLVYSVGGLARVAGQSRVRWPSPWLCLVLGLGAAGMVLGAAVARGETSGSGGPLSLFGVLRRDELDLRPIGLLLLLACGAASLALCTALGGAAFRSRGALWACVLLVFALPGFAVWAATNGLENRAASLGIERSAPLSSRLLAALRGLSDRDRDGFSAHFGGGDCNDGNAAVSPDAEDVPANGVDEDCTGRDARPSAPPQTTPSVPHEPRAQALQVLPEALNVVFITIDTLRYDLGYMGYPRAISPRIDELARESVVFERAYALASYTAKSLPPMLIGKYGGETQRGFSHFNRFDQRETFLPERLQKAGIHTVSVQGHWYFFQDYGLQRGFDVVNADAAPKSAQAEGDRGSTSQRLSDAVIGELERAAQSQRQFYLWAHYTDPHAEYVRHEGFDFGAGNRAAYESEVAFVDHHVGRVLDAMRRGPLWNRTVLILTSDHGEAFGEHGMIRHGFELWEELVRVPFLVRVPAVEPRRVLERRSTIDLVPTVLALLRVPSASGVAADFLSGQSLLPDLLASTGATLATRPVLVDMSEGPYNSERRAFIEGDLKLVTSAGRALGLYDLKADPAEKRSLLEDTATLQPILERFKAFRRELREVAVRR